MTKKRYVRLKLKMLLMVVLGAVVAGALGLFLKETVVDGLLEDPFASFFVWIATHLFGQTQQVALDAYQHYIRSYKAEWVLLGTGFLMLIAFYLAMGRFTRWLDQIASATAQVADLSAEEVALPKELEPLERDLNTIRRQLQDREAAAKAAERRRQDLISFLAHDLKTPLTSVVGYLTLLRDDPGLTPEQQAKFTGIALEKAQRLEELLGEFFDITRMDLGADPARMVPVQLTMLLEQLTDEFYPIFTERGLRCATEIEHHLSVLGDPDKLVRVFDNVLRNAVNYSTPDSEIRVTGSREGGQAEIRISNQGLEIPEGELANIFEKFYRLDAARSTRTGGAGLGLAIAKEIVERHGGTIRAESNGRSTSFIISLPLLDDSV